MLSEACRIIFLGVFWHGTIDYTLVLAVRIILGRRRLGDVVLAFRSQVLWSRSCTQFVSPDEAVSPIPVSLYFVTSVRVSH
jgi:hypothetical protein